MDEDPENISQDLPHATVLGNTNGGSIVEHPNFLEACALCRRTLVPENEAIGGVEPIGICGDCKFLFLEDLGTPIQDSTHRQHHHRRGRSRRYSSSESFDDLFSQQFSHIINLVRQNQNQNQNQSSVSEHEGPTDGDSSGRFLSHRTSSRTPPSGSRRWRRVLTDTESDGGFDYLESLYGDSESNVSFDWSRVFPGESDSDASGLDTEIFAHLDNESYIDSDNDTDIDPMRAGLDQWNSEDDRESEENELRISGPGPNENSFRWHGHRETRQQYIGNSGDYLDSRGFEELLEHLAEAESSIRGAPPTSSAFVKNLRRVVFSHEHDKHGGSACAICKDFLVLGTEVNELPCLHLYHPSCILPWLNSRNSCPLCRYELPTDDRDYEKGKRDTGRVREDIRERDTSEDESSNDDDDQPRVRTIVTVDHATSDSGSRGGGRGWFFLAAPIVSIVGIVLVLWLGNPPLEGRGSANRVHRAASGPPNRRAENRSRRWWSLF